MLSEGVIYNIPPQDWLKCFPKILHGALAPRLEWRRRPDYITIILSRKTDIATIGNNRCVTALFLTAGISNYYTQIRVRRTYTCIVNITESAKLVK